MPPACSRSGDGTARVLVDPGIRFPPIGREAASGDCRRARLKVAAGATTAPLHGRTEGLQFLEIIRELRRPRRSRSTATPTSLRVRASEGYDFVGLGRPPLCVWPTLTATSGLPRAVLQHVLPGVWRELRGYIEALDASALIATQPGRFGSDDPRARAGGAAVVAPMRQRSVADAVSAAHRRPALAALPPLAELGHGAHAHTQAELTAEAPQEPERADAPQRLDVL